MFHPMPGATTGAVLGAVNANLVSEKGSRKELTKASSVSEFVGDFHFLH